MFSLRSCRPLRRNSGCSMTALDQQASAAGRQDRYRRKRLFALLSLVWATAAACTTTPAPVASPSRQDPGMLVRLSELEIEPAHLSEYLSILQMEAAASTRLEPGVICIFPMQQQ